MSERYTGLVVWVVGFPADADQEEVKRWLLEQGQQVKQTLDRRIKKRFGETYWVSGPSLAQGPVGEDESDA